jgi:hypothetical protein
VILGQFARSAAHIVGLHLEIVAHTAFAGDHATIAVTAIMGVFTDFDPSMAPRAAMPQYDYKPVSVAIAG